jgi:hypothetical protein
MSLKVLMVIMIVTLVMTQVYSAPSELDDEVSSKMDKKQLIDLLLRSIDSASSKVLKDNAGEDKAVKEKFEAAVSFIKKNLNELAQKSSK